MENKTTLTISQELWHLINKDRINPNETMEDVIWRWKNLLDEKDGQKIII
jgi:hypothetical protein